MMRLPPWAWLAGSLGVGLLIGAAFLEDGTYWQALATQLGATFLLFLPIMLAERSIVTTVNRRIADVAAITRTEQFYLADEIVSHFSQAIGNIKPPKTSSDHLGRMLGAEGWRPNKVRDGYQLWSKEAQMIAVPVGKESLGRAIILGTCRYVQWDIDRYIELWNVTRPSGTDAVVPAGTTASKP
ncbi:hypothetical protein [Micromonospora sp. SL4-19]|uniref:hypothetical protein n=1 Tax=Micromonospora sp. SL4-19 TaxID=3399129 RepID=UPI003A4DA570